MSRNLFRFILTLFVFGASASHLEAETGLRIVVVSDLNEAYGSSVYSERVDAAVDRILELKPDLVISTGDMIAGQNQPSLLERSSLEEMWQAFHERVTDRLSAVGIPLLPTPGNHGASAAPGSPGSTSTSPGIRGRA